jgi:predicted esterase
MLALQAAAQEDFPTGRLVEGVRCRNDPSQTYTLYLPSAYTPARRWPLLLVFDPRGRSVLAAELFRGAAEELGWIIMSSNDTRSDGPMAPNARAVNAMFPDAMTRFASDPRRLVAAGFSGGAMLAWTVASRSGKLAGVIAASGRWIPGVFDKNLGWASFGTAGSSDFNYREMQGVDGILAKAGVPHRLEIFDGPHSWMPPELARFSLQWMELVAMHRGLRPVDAGLVKRLREWDEKEARRLQADGRLLAALRRWQAIARTYDGLADVAPAQSQVAALEKRREVQRALKEERRCRGFETQAVERVWKVIGRIRVGEEVMPPERIAVEMDLAGLQARAADKGECGAAAQRVLEAAFTQTAFYLMRDFLAAGRYRDAASVLTVATMIKSDRAAVWYNLACAEARSGDAASAIASLRRAVGAGYRDAPHMASDEDLASLHGRDDFRAILEDLKSRTRAP